jgi:hypothetical protein
LHSNDITVEIICKHTDVSILCCTLQNNEEMEMAVRGMLQMQCISKLPNTVHGRSRYGVVAVRLTTERPGSVWQYALLSAVADRTIIFPVAVG